MFGGCHGLVTMEYDSVCADIHTALRMQARRGSFHSPLWTTTCAWSAPAQSMSGTRSSCAPPAWASSLVTTVFHWLGVPFAKPCFICAYHSEFWVHPLGRIRCTNGRPDSGSSSGPHVEAEGLLLCWREVKAGRIAAGDESGVMLDAHAEAGYVVGTPFATEGNYDFAKHGVLTRRVADLGAVMLRHRLTAPPEEAYSLHRKLSGAYLACIKLRAKVPCRQLFYDSYKAYEFLEHEPAPQLPEQQAA